MQYEEERATKTLPDRTPVIDMTDTKKPRTPRSYDAIEKGALSLGLAERVELVQRLQESIKAEVDELEAKAKQAASIAGKL